MDCVGECLYLGSRYAACDKRILQDAGITAILNVTNQEPDFFAKEGLDYFRIPIDDKPHENLRIHLHPAADWIHERVSRGIIVLVHCRGGISRSPSIVLAYFVKYRGMTLREAYDHISKNRRIDPNPGFLRQLVMFETQLRGAASIRVMDEEEESHRGNKHNKHKGRRGGR